MNTDIQTLLDFLNRFGPQVEGRGEPPAPQSEVTKKLERFARGQSTPEERAEVCELLRQHPAWLRWLAEQVKASRARTGAPV